MTADRDPMAAVLEEVFAAAEAGGHPPTWWWLSFADPDKPAGAAHLGVAIVDAYGPASACAAAHARKCNPGGGVLSIDLDRLGDHLPPELRNRLLDEAEANRASELMREAAGGEPSPGPA